MGTRREIMLRFEHGKTFINHINMLQASAGQDQKFRTVPMHLCLHGRTQSELQGRATRWPEQAVMMD